MKQLWYSFLQIYRILILILTHSIIKMYLGFWAQLPYGGHTLPQRWGLLYLQINAPVCVCVYEKHWFIVSLGCRYQLSIMSGEVFLYLLFTARVLVGFGHISFFSVLDRRTWSTPSSWRLTPDDDMNVMQMPLCLQKTVSHLQGTPPPSLPATEPKAKVKSQL